MNVDQEIVVNINKSALDFHILNVDRVQQLCDPLKYLGITSFGYLKIFDNSRYLQICNEDIWSRHFIQNIHDPGVVLRKVLPFVDSEITSLIWPDERTDHLLQSLKDHNIFHGISFFKRIDNFIEIWSFGTDLNNPQIYEIYIKHNALLWKFVQYFREHAADLMDHSDPNRLAIHKNGNNIASAKKILVEDNISNFLQAINKKQYLMRCNQNWAFISQREKECLELISGELKQSNQVDFSPHIVERYLEEIKFKLGVTCKNEILDALKHSLAYSGQ